MSRQRSTFATAAAAYCRWCEGAPSNPEAETRSALGHLARLVDLAQELSAEQDVTEARASCDEEAWRAVLARMGALPLQYYWCAMEPLAAEAAPEPAEPVLGDLADDLADVYRDLKEGLELYERGHGADAEHHWALMFDAHWGRHALDAMSALHAWLRGPRA